MSRGAVRAPLLRQCGVVVKVPDWKPGFGRSPLGCEAFTGRASPLSQLGLPHRVAVKLKRGGRNQRRASFEFLEIKVWQRSALVADLPPGQVQGVIINI